MPQGILDRLQHFAAAWWFCQYQLGTLLYHKGGGEDVVRSCVEETQAIAVLEGAMGSAYHAPVAEMLACVL